MDDRGSIIDRGRNYFLFATTVSRPALEPLRLLSHEHQEQSLRGQSGQDVRLTIHFHLVSRLRKRGAITPLHHTSSWHDAYLSAGCLHGVVFSYAQ
jgi:hypothetical protein